MTWINGIVIALEKNACYSAFRFISEYATSRVKKVKSFVKALTTKANEFTVLCAQKIPRKVIRYLSNRQGRSQLAAEMWS